MLRRISHQYWIISMISKQPLQVSCSIWRGKAVRRTSTQMLKIEYFLVATVSKDSSYLMQKARESFTSRLWSLINSIGGSVVEAAAMSTNRRVTSSQSSRCLLDHLAIVNSCNSRQVTQIYCDRSSPPIKVRGVWTQLSHSKHKMNRSKSL